jgi:sugar (pentulose or hexulose) kinase
LELMRRVSVFDVGKTNAKLVVHDLETGADVFEARRPNRSLPGPPYPHADVDGLWTFLIRSLADAAAAHAIDAVVVTTHGAAAALLAGGDLALPILDYEHPLDETAAAYDRVRPPFDETLSPRLGVGLNLGAQIFWQERTWPEAFAATTAIVPYPQYWGFRLTGALAADVCSLGSHTDLWNPLAGAPSSLVQSRGWAGRLAPVKTPFETLGGIRPAVAHATGLPAGLPVFVGIHDSNASLLPHLVSRPAPFAVVSTGTWVVVFAVGAEPRGLDPDRDTLANVDAFARPVPSARFMGGREFEILAGVNPAAPTDADVARVIADRIMCLPSFVSGSGPFPRAEGRWSADPVTLSPGERTAAASLYAALMTEVALGLAGASGPTVIEGPFSGNRVYAEALALLTGRRAIRAAGSTGTSAGAALLAAGPDARRPPIPETEGGAPVDLGGLADYAARWRDEAGAV